jgi:hypothetical protein
MRHEVNAVAVVLLKDNLDEEMVVCSLLHPFGYLKSNSDIVKGSLYLKLRERLCPG